MSTQWFTVLGHQFQARPVLDGTYVDENWYDFDYGTFDYRVETHPQLVRGWAEQAEQAGFQARLTDYDRFPVDTGTLVARRLLDPDGTLPVALMSCNLYVEPEEMAILGAAGAIAADELGLRVAVVAVSGLSGGWINRWITPSEDRFELAEHDQWNRRILDTLAGEGAARTLELRGKYADEAEVDSQFRALDFLYGATGGLAAPASVRAYDELPGNRRHRGCRDHRGPRLRPDLRGRGRDGEGVRGGGDGSREDRRAHRFVPADRRARRRQGCGRRG
jgi:2-aminophenol/2-amino-5-chlorophenol 1,6-dioxygenase alpha subunit